MADYRKLPQLAALRAFEAAARYESFSRAADEIHVTPGAISHQVRALEEELGVQLFARNGKRITITDAGQRFATTIRKSLSEIAIAAETLQIQSRQKRLVISAPPSFASRWLAPRLWKFINLHPDIEVVLQSSSQLSDLAQEFIDVGLRFGRGRYTGLASEKLLDDYYYPVASPDYRAGQLPQTPQELHNCNLLCMDAAESWQPWFEAAGLCLPEPAGGLVIEDSSLTVHAAVGGTGIALTRHTIAWQEIAAGNLVRLFDIAVKSDFSYYFVCVPESLNKVQIHHFRNWIKTEISQFKSDSRWPA